jgi:hypothetical protein
MANENDGDNLVSDISKLTPKLNWEANPEPKGEVVRPYGSQKRSARARARLTFLAAGSILAPRREA